MKYRPRWKPWLKKVGRVDEGLHYDAKFLTPGDRAEIMAWLATLKPLWEWRFSEFRPPPEGQAQRRLLRPVYWLGNWQFACLDYYRPPHGLIDRAVAAEAFPPVLARIGQHMESLAHDMFTGHDMPAGWKLNTCLVNFYGSRKEGDAWVDCARVGEHKDFEPGPVGSLSMGERALFQFVTSRRPGERDDVVKQQWLDDGGLQIFGGQRWKSRTFHRVQRVDHKAGVKFTLDVENFETRRINFTFRFVPEEHVIRFKDLGADARRDVAGYVKTLAESSKFFAAEWAAAQST